MSDNLSPVEQARAARWAREWLHERRFNEARVAMDQHIDILDPPETVESLRAERDDARGELRYVRESFAQLNGNFEAVCGERDEAGKKLAHAEWVITDFQTANRLVREERDEALAEMEEVGSAWRQEQILHRKAWATVRNLQAELAGTRTDLHKANAQIYRLRAAVPVADAAWGRSKSDRTWHKGADEPEGVNRVTDIGGDEWGRANGKWSHPHAGPSRSWANLLNAYGPLTEVISR